MVYLIPTKQYLENITSLLNGGTASLALDYLRVGYEEGFWDSDKNINLIPNPLNLTKHITNIYNAGPLEDLRDYIEPVAPIYKAQNLTSPPSTGYIIAGLLFKFRIVGVNEAGPFGPIGDPESERILIKIPTLNGITVTINAFEFDGTYNAESTPYFFASTPIVQITTDVTADWDCYLMQITPGVNLVEVS